jgi:Transport and Golgi organisation 2
MCTVTFIPSGNHLFFTSSRDERAERAIAVFPELHELKGRRLLFPRDLPAGGSWIAVHESGNAAVLLNGAIRAHLPEPPYRKSRGLILLDLISSLSPVDAFEESDFNRIEPFTVILFEGKKLFSGKWDGRMKWLESLNIDVPHIWSSVTLYEPETIEKREGWFSKWLSYNPDPSVADIIRFHQRGGDGDPVNDLLMNRAGKLFTNSISSVRLSPETAAFRYVDLRSGKTSDHFLPLRKTITVKA